MSFKTQLLVEEIRRSNKVLLESTCKGLSVEQERVVRNIYNEFVPLIEATLTPDQIKQIFTSAEQSATAAGTNRSGLGKAVDVAKLPVQAVQKVNDIINKAGQWAQNTKPVQAFDQKFEDLKAKISAKFPNLAQNLTQAGEWAKANPGKTAVIIGVLTAIASLAGGPIGGAIAGQILRGTTELMKGEKLSTAVGKGVKTAALGFIAGKAFEMLGDWMAGFREQLLPVPGAEESGLATANWGATSTIRSPGMEWTRTTDGFNVTVFPEEQELIREAMAGVARGEHRAFDALYKIAEYIDSSEYQELIAGVTDAARQTQLDNDSLLQFINTAKEGLQASGQGAVAASTGSTSSTQGQQNPQPAQPQPTPESLTVSDIDKIFEHIENIYELHRIKTLSNVNEGVFDKLKQVGANLTTKITADKLMKAWQAAGSPTDSDAVAKILRDAGVDDSIITSTFQSMNIAQPAAPGNAPAAPGSPRRITAKEINKVLPTLKLNELKRIQQLVNDTLAKKSQQPVTP